ncbi:MAG TPA: dehydrogenase E1 component subunit alpha/beta [Thermoanaerobaculia bacterium]|nr:dehydrogenase E1 component subunit alpha/beta [Thermoanaerobaculia bacterium]HQR67727.1 dehydrogenase E1 component subunit alpha/beta [Thermoanaerobaculia bacterium]
MATDAAPDAAEKYFGLSKDDLVRAFRIVYTSRRIDDKEIQLKRQNRIFFQISGAGHEAAGAAIAFHMKPGTDWLFGYYRDRALCLGLGVTPYEMFLEAVGAAEDAASGGRQMPSHWASRRLNIFTMSSPTATECLQGVGAAEAGRFLSRSGARALPGVTSSFSDDEVVVVTIGDGSTSEGEFWEALNAACTLKLPVVFVVEDNGYAISVPVEVNTPGGSISKLVRGHPGLFVVETDGCDFLESYDAFRWAFAYARERKGPVLVHAHVVRPYSHSLSDDERLYKPAAERQKEAERDPVELLSRFLVAEGLVPQDELAALKAACDAEVNAAADRAAALPQPDPARVLENVTSPAVDPASSAFDTEDRPESSGSETTMVDLINACLRDEMARDGRIVVWGEDVADASREEILAECKGKGGVFKVTAGLQKLYGADRVFNSPLAEANIVGRAIGWAARGLKPVVEIQFFDYIWPAMLQLRDELATIRWRSDGLFSAPVVVRCAIGGYLTGGGPYHSQSGEVAFTHLPGLRVVMPSSALDANGLLRTAIRCDDPVLFLEHKHLYRQTHNKGTYPGREYMIPFGKAKTVRAGTAATVVTYGATVFRSVTAANRLADETGRDVEVIDLRSLAPYDWEAVAASVKRTNRLLVVHEDWRTHGFGAEIAARAADELFPYLDAPVRRVAAKDVFCAYAPRLEDATLPQAGDIHDALAALVAY